MSHRLRRGLVFTAFGLALAAALPLLSRGDGPPRGDKYALLIGVRHYDPNELRDLPYAEADMTGLADVLKKAGYTRVVLLTQTAGADTPRLFPMAANIRTSLKGVLADLSADDTVLVAFAGHGVQFAGEDNNYFCPMDAKLADKKTLISLSEVYKELESSPAGTRLLLADCCRNDPRSEDARAADRVKLESVTRPQRALPPGGVAAFFSCSAGEKAFERAELGHGVFFHFVIKGLQGEADLDGDGQVDLGELAQYTTKKVRNFVKDAYGDEVRQQPEMIGKTHGTVALVKLEGSTTHGDAALVKPEDRVRPDPTQPAPAGARPAPLDCTTAKGASEPEVKKAQEAWAKYLGRKVEEEFEIAPGAKMKFALVPPGKFIMGSSQNEKDYVHKTFGDVAGGWAKQEIEHEVEITKPFYMGVYDVTQAQYEAVTSKTPSKFLGAELPVEQVSWEDADAFAKGLTEKAKDGLVYHLPTEAEWEYACRGGRPYSQPFGIGDGASLSSREANFDGNNPYGAAEKGAYLAKTTPVGSYKPNALGLYDMQGNVWQWCSDWYGEYPTARAVDPTGPGTASTRVYRGGRWCSDAWDCRAAARGFLTPGSRYAHLGFRLALVPPSGVGK